MKIPSAEEAKIAGDTLEVYGDESKEMDQSTFPHYKRVSDYLLGACIGEGSFAKVRLGFHCPTKEKVAVKIINKARARRDSYVYKNLHREGRLLQMLRHPNVVQVFDILETGNNYYLITELCNGGELIDIVTEEGALAEDVVRKYMKQLVDAVFYMQERRIVHRDLKVENLLLDSEDNLKIIDFGLSNIIPDPNCDMEFSLSTQCGSPAYAAPELLAKKSYGPKVDVWSIGIITYALLVGKLPFTVDPFSIPKLCKKMMRGEMNPIPSQISSSCRFFIRKLLTPDHMQRPSISDVARMKWLAMQHEKFISKTRSSSLASPFSRIYKSSFSSSYLGLYLNPIINSSVVSKMTSKFGFTNSEVIQSVQKNRPGPALTTYHLLLKKEKVKRSISSLVSSELQPSINISAVTTTEDNDVDENYKNNSSSEISRSAHRQMTSTPGDCSNNGLTSTSSDLNINKRIQKIESTTEEKKKKNTYPSFAQNHSNNDNIFKEKTHEISSQAIKNQVVLGPIRRGSYRSSLDNDITRQFKHIVESQKTKKEMKLDEFSQKYSNNDSANLTPAGASPTTDVAEMLNKMRMARQLLQKNQQEKHVIMTSTNNKSRQDFDQQLFGDVSSTNNHGLLLLSENRPQPHNVFGKLLTERKSTSQQGPRKAKESNRMNQIYRRPLSHNDLLPLTQGSVAASQRPTLQNSTSKSTRPTNQYHFPLETNKAKEKIELYPTKQTSPLTLPLLVPKQTVVKTERKSQPVQPTYQKKHARPVRHSFPAAQHQHNRIGQSLSVAAESKNNSVRRSSPHRRTSKSLNVSKWQNCIPNHPGSNYKSHYAHIDERSANSSSNRQRPKKVISEPIAAAISYLTSTKNKTFRKNKTPSITTG